MILSHLIVFRWSNSTRFSLRISPLVSARTSRTGAVAPPKCLPSITRAVSELTGYPKTLVARKHAQEITSAGLFLIHRSCVSINLTINTCGVQVYILYVLRSTHVVLDNNSVLGAVTSSALGHERIWAGSTACGVYTVPERAYHKVRVLKSVGLNLVRPAGIYFTGTKG